MNHSATTFEAMRGHSLRNVVLRRMAIVACMLAVVMFGLVYPFPLHTRRWGAIFDLAHAPSFCILLLLVVGLLDPPAIGLPRRFPTIVKMSLPRVLLVVAVLLGVGLTGEFLQKFADRSPSWLDVAANACGLLAGLCWILGWSCNGVSRMALFSALPTILAAVSVNPLLEIRETVLLSRDMPLLASFERPRELHGWAARDADMVRSDEWTTDGTHSLHVTLRPGKYPGVACISPEPDWRGYDTLQIDLHNSGLRPLPLIVKIHDQDHQDSDFDHHDRFHRDIVVPAGEDMTVRIALKDIESAPATRTMNLAAMTLISIFTVDVREGDSFFVDNVRLQ